MKIGILTLWGTSNYGQNLQAYALQRFLRDAGHDTFLIRYPLIKYQDNTPFKWLKMFLRNVLPPVLLCLTYKAKGKNISLSSLKKHSYSNEMKSISQFHAFYRDPSYLIHLRAISQFFDAHINQSMLFYSSIADLKACPPEADVYITGSDQVWNFWGQPLKIGKHETVDAFFLNFGKPETKRISYATSFGTRIIDKESAKIIKPLINKFSYVSVREESSITLCECCNYKKAEWVPDPTLLLSMDHYRILYNKYNIIKPDKPYCLIYMMRDNINFLYSAYAWAKLKNIEIRLITNNGLIQHICKETFATIPEWLSLIDNAEYVITDSYHGSIFSIIFGKSFGIIPFMGCENDIRLNDLFKRFKLRFPLLDDDEINSFISNDEIKAASVILGEIYKKYTFDWFNKIFSRQMSNSIKCIKY
jgi:hypothetical protein